MVFIEDDKCCGEKKRQIMESITGKEFAVLKRGFGKSRRETFR